MQPHVSMKLQRSGLLTREDTGEVRRSPFLRGSVHPISVLEITKKKPNGLGLGLGTDVMSHQYRDESSILSSRLSRQ